MTSGFCRTQRRGSFRPLRGAPTTIHDFVGPCSNIVTLYSDWIVTVGKNPCAGIPGRWTLESRIAGIDRLCMSMNSGRSAWDNCTGLAWSPDCPELHDLPSKFTYAMDCRRNAEASFFCLTLRISKFESSNFIVDARCIYWQLLIHARLTLHEFSILDPTPCLFHALAQATIS